MCGGMLAEAGLVEGLVQGSRKLFSVCILRNALNAIAAAPEASPRKSQPAEIKAG